MGFLKVTAPGFLDHNLTLSLNKFFLSKNTHKVFFFFNLILFTFCSFLILTANNFAFANEVGTLEEPVKRGELIKLLVSSKFPNFKERNCISSPFKDIDKNNEFTPYICYAKSKEYISGYSDGTFKTNETVDLDSISKLFSNIFIEDFEADNQEDYIKNLNKLNLIPSGLLCKDIKLSNSQIIEMIDRVNNPDKYKEQKVDYTQLKDCKNTFVNPLSDSSCEGKYYESRGYASHHTGVDLPMKMQFLDQPCWVNSVGNGTVSKVGRNHRTLGNYIVIHHENDAETLYAHLSSNIVVEAGQSIQMFDRIAIMGGTGNSTVVHLHLSYSENGKDVVQYSNRINPVGIIPF